MLKFVSVLYICVSLLFCKSLATSSCDFNNPTVYYISELAGDGIITAMTSDRQFLIAVPRYSGYNTKYEAVIFQFLNGKLIGPMIYSLPIQPVHVPNAIAFSPDDRYVVMTNTDPAYITVFSFNKGVLGKGKDYPLPKQPGTAYSVGFSPDQKHIIAAYSPQSIALFDFNNGVITNAQSYPLPKGASNVGSVTFSPNGKYIAAVNLYSENISFLTFLDEKPSQGLNYNLPKTIDFPSKVVFSPDSAYIFIPGTASVIAEFDITDNTLINMRNYTLPDHQDDATDIIFSPSGSTMVTTDSTNTISAFTYNKDGSLSNGKSYTFYNDLTLADFSQGFFSPDGNYLIISSQFTPNITIVEANNC